MITRAQMLKIAKMDRTAYDALARRRQLPFDTSKDRAGSGWKRYTVCELLLIMVVEEISAQFSQPWSVACTRVADCAQKISDQLPMILATGLEANQGRVVSDILMLYAVVPPGDRVNLVGDRAVIGGFLENYETVVALTANLTRAASVMFVRSDHEGIDLLAAQ